MPKKHFISGDLVAFDTETSGLYPFHGDLPFAFSFCNAEGEIAYFEFPVDPLTRKVLYDSRPDAFDAISVLLGDASVAKVGHNIKFDVRMANAAGMVVEGRLDDTMFMAHAADTCERSYGLKQLCLKYGGMDNEDQDELLKAVKSLRLKVKRKLPDWKLGFDEVIKADGTVKLESAIPADYWLPRAVNADPTAARLFGKPEYDGLCRTYAELDAVRTMLLYKFYQQLMDDLRVRHTYEHEMYELWPEVFHMENRGVRIDLALNDIEIQNCIRKMEYEHREVVKAAWPGFELKPANIRKLLYEKLALPCAPERRTEKTGLPSTDSDALRDHAGHPVVGHILKHGAAGKAYASFFAKYKQLAIPDHVVPGSYCLIGNFRQTGQRTARFSCSEPNLQQVTSIESSRSADPIDARGPFGPRPGYVWLHIDFKGMEVRVFADCAQEPNMLQAIRDGREIHDEVTNRGWGGKDNPAAIKECIHTLGLDGSELGKESADIYALWKEWGLKPTEGWRKLTDRDRHRLVAGWLAGHGWDIVKAQESVKRKVTKNKAKMVTFCKVYGGGAAAIKDLLHLPLEEAQAFLNQYNNAFPRITEYQKEMQREAKANGCIRTRWDRRLSTEVGFEYKATNYMIQGTSADLLKSGMVKCGRFLRGSGLDAHMILTIHDELVFEVAKSDFTKPLVRKLQSLMEDHDGRLGVTMPTDPSYVVGSWANKIKLKV